MELTTRNESNDVQEWTEKRIELVKRMYCKGCSDDEFSLFIAICKKTGLSPEMKQIYAFPRNVYDREEKRHKKVMSVQTSIDGFRLIADRTGKYVPGRKASFIYDKNGELVSATAYVKKLTKDGTWHEVEAEAFYKEYVQAFEDRETRKMEPTKFWKSMGHVMLSKCAESLVLRKAFPAELSGLYTQEEMAQSSAEMDSSQNDSKKRHSEIDTKKTQKPVTIDLPEEPQHTDEEIEGEFYEKFSDCGDVDLLKLYVVGASSKSNRTTHKFMEACLDNDKSFREVFSNWKLKQEEKKRQDEELTLEKGFAMF